MPIGPNVKQNSYQWARPGDVNAFFGLMLDNIAGLVLMVSLLAGVFQFPVDFALKYMVPGTAIGVLIGDLMFFWLAFRYAKQTGLTNVTAMPLGLDTPSTIGMVLLVLGPSFQDGLANGMDEQAAAMHAWHIGICSIFITGIVKMILAFCSNWIRRVFPRAGLLGSLAAIALLLIAFTQMPELAANPIVGFASLAIVLVTLVGRNHLPLKIPGAFGAVLVGCLLYYALYGVQLATEFELVEKATGLESVWFPTGWIDAFKFKWLGSLSDSLVYMGYVIPFAIATVIGGIDCAESAASVGDDFETRKVIGIEAVATLLASLCGGVIQTTPYIGHPAYKAMGGRAAYTLATAIFVGGAGVIGYFSLLFLLIPKAAVLPILVFIGIEITAQSFHATPRRHYAALAIACIPAIAKLVMIYLGQFALVINYDSVPPVVAENLQQLWLHLSVLAGGFILTSLIWASATARIIDRRFIAASIYFAFGGLFTLFGLMHSPIFGDKMFLPWQLNAYATEQKHIIIEFAATYLVMALLMYGLGMIMKDKVVIITTDEEYERIGT